MKETVDFSKLIDEAKKGSDAAFKELYNISIKTAYRTASLLLKSPDDIEDVLQNSYLKVHSRLGELKNPESFESWVKTIVENESKNYIKKEKSISAPLIFFKNKNDERSEEWEKPVPQEYMEKNELRESVSKIVDNLSPEVRACIVLFHFEDKSLNEISEILAIPTGTVKSRLHNGRKQIEKEFNKLRKKDPTLYGIAAIPAVMAFLTYKSANIAVPVAMSESVLAGTAATGAAAGLTGSVAAGSAAAGTTVASSAATTATSIAVKVTAVAVAGSLTVGGSVAIKNYVENKKENSMTTLISSVPVIEETCTIAEIIPETQSVTEPLSTIPDNTSEMTKAQITSALTKQTTQTQKTTQKQTSTVATPSTAAPTTQTITTTNPATTATPTTLSPTTGPENVYSLSGGVISQYTGNDSSVSIPSKVGADTVTAIGAGAFASNPNIKSVAIPSTVTQIGQEAFADCTRLSSVSLPSSLEHIGIGAFYGCTALSSVSVPSGTKTISDEAFAECSSLKSIAIPSSVTSIADDAFYGCDSLTIKCSEGSAAHEFALGNGINFTLI